MPKEHDNKQQASYEYKIDSSSSLKLPKNRPPTNLGTKQGDHVHAFGLIKRGLSNALTNLTLSETSELHKQENRESLRKKKTDLKRFVSAVASLNPNHSGHLESDIKEILVKYNTDRTPKKDLRKKTKERNVNNDDNYSDTESVKAAHNKNGKLQRDALAKIAKRILKFFNKVPGITHLPIEEHKKKNESSVVNLALFTLDNIPGNADEEITKAIANLIDYPEIKPEALKDHTKAHEALNKVGVPARNNTQESLAEALARHIHITLAAYPRLEKDKAKIVAGVTKTIIEESWPNHQTDTVITLITDQVTKNLYKLQSDTKPIDERLQVLIDSNTSIDGSSNHSQKASESYKGILTENNFQKTVGCGKISNVSNRSGINPSATPPNLNKGQTGSLSL